MSKAKLYIGSGLFVGAALFFLWSEDESESYHTTSPKRSTKVSVVPTGLAENRDTAKQFALRSRTHNLKLQKAGITKIPSEARGNILNLTIKYQPTQLHCQGGEVEAIVKSLTDIDRKNLLLTVENLSSIREKAESIEFSARDLLKPFNHSFKVNVKKTNQLYGVFICSDLKNKNRCLGKRQASFGPGSKEVTADQIFSFHKILADQTNLHLFSSLSNRRNRILSSKFLTAKLAAPLDGRVSRSIKSMDSKLDNLPLEAKGKEIIIKLTKSDGACVR